MHIIQSRLDRSYTVEQLTHDAGTICIHKQENNVFLMHGTCLQMLEQHLVHHGVRQYQQGKQLFSDLQISRLTVRYRIGNGQLTNKGVKRPNLHFRKNLHS